MLSVLGTGVGQNRLCPADEDTKGQKVWFARSLPTKCRQAPNGRAASIGL